MHAHRYFQTPREFEFFARGFETSAILRAVGTRRSIYQGHASPKKAQRDQSVIRILTPVVMKTFDVRHVDALIGGNSAIRPIRPAAAQTGFLNRADILHGMIVAAHVVAVIANRGDTGINGFGRGQFGSAIHVDGLHRHAVTGSDGEVAVAGFVAGHGTQIGGPHVPVRVD